MEHLHDKPTRIRDYVAINATWAAVMTGLLAGTARSRAAAPSSGELPVMGLAAFALSKAMSKEKVGVWARAPLVEIESNGDRSPKGSGLRYVLGELVTCSRCLGTWSSLGLVALRVARPREGRIVASVLAVAALNDVLQTGFTFATSKANQTESGAELAGLEVRRATTSGVHGDGGIG